MQIFQMLTHSIVQSKKTTLINFTIHLIRQIFKYEEAVKFTVVDASFPKSQFFS